MRTSLLISAFSLLLAFSNAQALSNLPTLPTNEVPGASLTGGASSQATDTATGKNGNGDGKHTASDKDATQTKDTAGVITDAPSLTSAAGGIVHLSNLPTLSGVTIPSLIVPNTADAPFMQQSSLPEGTIFICVGAILGFLGACVVGWRGMTAWLLHRSVKRAAAAQYMTDTKVRYAASGGYTTQNVSMENLTALNNSSYAYSGGGGGAAGAKKASRQFTPNSSLFFSPTAGAGMHGASKSNTTSTYLPAGYYASGSSLPAAGAAMAHLGVGPQGAGYGRLSSQPNLAVTADSPPDSPGQYPSDRPGDRTSGYSQTRMGTGHARTSSRTAQRAPSSYLDDMFEAHPTGPRERF